MRACGARTTRQDNWRHTGVWLRILAAGPGARGERIWRRGGREHAPRNLVAFRLCVLVELELVHCAVHVRAVELVRCAGNLVRHLDVGEALVALRARHGGQQNCQVVLWGGI